LIRAYTIAPRRKSVAAQLRCPARRYSSGQVTPTNFRIDSKTCAEAYDRIQENTSDASCRDGIEGPLRQLARPAVAVGDVALCHLCCGHRASYDGRNGAQLHAKLSPLWLRLSLQL